jgi:hypothetical protein
MVLGGIFWGTSKKLPDAGGTPGNFFGGPPSTINIEGHANWNALGGRISVIPLMGRADIADHNIQYFYNKFH